MLTRTAIPFLGVISLTVFASLVGFAPIAAAASQSDQVLYTGRFDFTDPTKVVFSHVGNSIKIPGFADGWRPNGTVTLVKGAADAKDGTSYLKLYNHAWVNFANDAKPGDTFAVTGWMRGAQNGDLGKLKLEFKDQGQNTIGTNEGLVTLTTQWQQFTTTAVAPTGTCR